jgi:hypothetical protein
MGEMLADEVLQTRQMISMSMSEVLQPLQKEHTSQVSGPSSPIPADKVGSSVVSG